jgi:hypothetical protein
VERSDASLLEDCRNGDEAAWEALVPRCERVRVETADIAPLADEAFETVETQHEVRTAVDALDERCRDLITLLFYTAEPRPTPKSPRYSECRKGASGRPGRVV